MKKRIAIVLVLLFCFCFCLTACGNTVTVRFNTDGGTSIDPIKVKKGEPIGSVVDTVKEGHTFDGWYTDNTYSYSSKWNIMTDVVEKNTTLFAKWNKSTIAGEPEFKNKYNYFTSVYGMEANNIFETVTFSELDRMLSSSGTYLVFWGGAWDPATVDAAVVVNKVAKEYGVSKIYNFDPLYDGGYTGKNTDISNPTSIYGTIAIAACNDTSYFFNDYFNAYSSLMYKMQGLKTNPLTASLSQYVSTARVNFSSEEVPVLHENFSAPILSSGTLMLVNGLRENEMNHTLETYDYASQQSPLAVCTGTPGGNSPAALQAYENYLKAFFDGCCSYGPPGGATEKTLKYLVGTYDYFKEADFRIDHTKESEIPSCVFNSVTFFELMDMFDTREGVFPLFFGGIWCPNTRAVAYIVNDVARENGWAHIPVFDFDLFGRFHSAYSSIYPLNLDTRGGMSQDLYMLLMEKLGDYQNPWTDRTVIIDTTTYSRMTSPTLLVF